MKPGEMKLPSASTITSAFELIFLSLIAVIRPSETSTLPFSIIFPGVIILPFMIFSFLISDSLVRLTDHSIKTRIHDQEINSNWDDFAKCLQDNSLTHASPKYFSLLSLSWLQEPYKRSVSIA